MRSRNGSTAATTNAPFALARSMPTRDRAALVVMAFVDVKIGWEPSRRRKRNAPFDGGRKAGRERHNVMEASWLSSSAEAAPVMRRLSGSSENRPQHPATHVRNPWQSG